MKDKRVLCTWSGGIDSTAVLANLLLNDWKVTAVSLRTTIYGSAFAEREERARTALLPHLQRISEFEHVTNDARWLFKFSSDGKEVPHRNKRIMDYLLDGPLNPSGIKTIAMGEYIGADTWVVRDHVAGSDADARALGAYLYNEYGLDYRLITLADFGKSRYKCDRVHIGMRVLGRSMFLTTNCLADSARHCGVCYKCVERHVAFKRVCGYDDTPYTRDPSLSERFPLYVAQMEGVTYHEN